MGQEKSTEINSKDNSGTIQMGPEWMMFMKKWIAKKLGVIKETNSNTNDSMKSSEMKSVVIKHGPQWMWTIKYKIYKLYSFLSSD